jgi:hypothetical protein
VVTSGPSAPYPGENPTRGPILLLALLPSLADAGPWLREPGAGYAKLGFSHFASRTGVREGESTGLPFRSDEVSFYGEVGLPDGTQLVVSLPFVAATQVAANGTRFRHQSVGDIRVELDRSLHPELPIAAGLEVKFPGYRRPERYTSARGLDNELIGALSSSFPELGDANVDLTAKFLAGGAWTRPIAGWVSIELGPRLRFGPYSEGVFGALSTGIWLVDGGWAISLYSNANANIIVAEDDLPSRQLVYTQLSTFVTGFGFAPAAALEVGVGTVPVASNASTGWSVNAGLSTTF